MDQKDQCHHQQQSKTLIGFQSIKTDYSFTIYQVVEILGNILPELNKYILQTKKQKLMKYRTIVATPPIILQCSFSPLSTGYTQGYPKASIFLINLIFTILNLFFNFLILQI
ncbi:hypothetical protein pb186bvf_013466 [Paramecium bursaria]